MDAHPLPFEIPPSWRSVLAAELEQPYLLHLASFVETERRFHAPIYPPAELTFNALKQTPFENVKVVIMGQDPYHGFGQAHGLSFSVPMGVSAPPSLRNMYKELKTDLGIAEANHGCLLSWAHQGVLLLNATLSVREGQPKSHYGQGWERFTDALIGAVVAKKDPVVFLLWGASAKEKVRQAANTHHLTLTAAHPSPFSAHQGFFGCRHFSKANNFLEKAGREPVDWRLYHAQSNTPNLTACDI